MRQEDYYSRASALVGLEALARELGRDPIPMMARFGFYPAMLTDPEAPVSYRRWCELLETCADEWQCPDFGLRLGASQNLDLLGLVGQVARLTDTVVEGLRELERHMHLRSSAFTTRLDEGDAAAGRLPVIVYETKLRVGEGRQMAELGVSLIRNVLSTLSGHAQVQLFAVMFRQAAPDDDHAVRRHFKCPIVYGQPHNALYFSPCLLGMPTSNKDLSLKPAVRAFLDKATGRNDHDITGVATQIISNLLVTGRCTREVLAERLQMHPRTLQRRLEAAGTSFSALLDQQRQQRALTLVRGHAMPLSQVAFLLGFADQSSFNQAFRRWTGVSPSRYLKDGCPAQ
jgi:AraC-like DNA-binding protein